MEIYVRKARNTTIFMAGIALTGQGLGMWPDCQGADIDRVAPFCNICVWTVVALDTVRGVNGSVMAVWSGAVIGNVFQVMGNGCACTV
ncbi:MAG: hypothetical protein M8352_10770, partial [ANME-2 cluster archaeon]|nr:hypothetical protein [ANME-2 cluster archaeon]